MTPLESCEALLVTGPIPAAKLDSHKQQRKQKPTAESREHVSEAITILRHCSSREMCLCVHKLNPVDVYSRKGESGWESSIRTAFGIRG
jgi:hypothetical protein